MSCVHVWEGDHVLCPAQANPELGLHVGLVEAGEGPPGVRWLELGGGDDLGLVGQVVKVLTPVEAGQVVLQLADNKTDY